MSEGSVRGGAPDRPGPADPLDPAQDAGRARATGPAGAPDPPYPADVPEWHDLAGSSYLYELSGPEQEGLGRSSPRASTPAPRAEPAPAPPGGLRQADRQARPRLLVVALITAIISAVAGGLLGGYIGAMAAGTPSGYNLGTVSPGLTNRPPNSVARLAARVPPSVGLIQVN